MILAHLAQFRSRTQLRSACFSRRAEVSFSALGLWHNMGWLARASSSSFSSCRSGRWPSSSTAALYFSAARKQSREFAPKVAGALKDGRLDEAIKVADRNKKSHLAEVVTAGLQEFRSFGSGGSITEAADRKLASAPLSVPKPSFMPS